MDGIKLKQRMEPVTALPQERAAVKDMRRRGAQFFTKAENTLKQLLEYEVQERVSPANHWPMAQECTQDTAGHVEK